MCTLLSSSLSSMRCFRPVMCASFGGKDLATSPATTALLLYRKPSSSVQTGRDSLSPDSLQVVHCASFASSGFTCTGQLFLQNIDTPQMQACHAGSAKRS